MKFIAARAMLLPIVVVASVAGATVQVQAKSQTLEKIRDTGKLALGYREASIPFAYLGSDQKPVGLSLDLCAAVAEKVKSSLKLDKLDVTYVAVNASNRIPLLQNGTIDIECGSTTNTLDRQKQVAFSVATYVTSPRWLVLAASNISDCRYHAGLSQFKCGREGHRRREARRHRHAGKGSRRIHSHAPHRPRNSVV